MTKLDVNLYLTLISISIAYGYVLIYMLMGKNQNPLTYRYQKVLNNKKLLKKHIIFGCFLSIIGVFRFKSLALETYLFSPLIFLLLLLLTNSIIKKKYNRNILIETFNKYSWQRRVNRKATFLDKFFGLSISLISLISPLIMKKDKWKEINYERKLYKSYGNNNHPTATITLSKCF